MLFKKICEKFGSNKTSTDNDTTEWLKTFAL